MSTSELPPPLLPYTPVDSADSTNPALVGAPSPWDVEKVAASMIGGAPASGTESPVPFFHMLQRLKTTKREGWRRFGIDQYVSPLLDSLPS